MVAESHTTMAEPCPMNDEAKRPKEKRRTFIRRYLRQYGMLKRPAPGDGLKYGAQSLAESIGYALEGLWFALKSERNMRIDFYMVIGAYALAFLVGLGYQDWILLVIMMTLVVFSELANTTVEWLVDLITDGRFDLRAKRIKDMSAAACLVVALGGYGVAFLIFWPYLRRLWLA